ncbi:hypothetical protein [uncultured Sphingomonas sp.]|uniref:hypothetical protein n=1 Tax=uncultured Sphingomonas sp. TaxID=158754 RepID=UPI0035CBBECE
MSSYDLIPEEVYENLPEEAADKFVVLVRTAQANLQRMMDDSNSSDFAGELRSQFMAIIQGTADALGIEGLATETPSMDYSDYNRFQIIVTGIVAKVRLLGSALSMPDSVELGRVTKAKIHQEVDQLRTYIAALDVTDAKKQAMNDKLDDLLHELSKRRLSFARVMAVAASIMGVVGGSAGAIAAAPKIPSGISFIISLIGQDKEIEDREKARLSPPQLKLEQTPTSVGGGGFADDLDDDVPF